jgi:hypothetical protein
MLQFIVMFCVSSFFEDNILRDFALKNIIVRCSVILKSDKKEKQRETLT